MADAGATTSNSALTGLASIEGTLSLNGGATITTSGSLTNNGTIDLNFSSSGAAPAAATLILGRRPRHRGLRPKVRQGVGAADCQRDEMVELVERGF